MKNLLILILLILFLIQSISCHHNRLKTNEKELAKEISSEEKEKKEAERIALENQVQDTLANIRSGFQYKEDRSVDPAHPPVVIDFSQEIPVRELKLRYIASKVSYMVLQVPDDSIYFLWGSRLNFTPNSIIINNNLGIHRFGRDGRYIEPICRNTFNAPRKIDPDKPFSGFFPKETFRGAWSNHVQTAGNTVFYKYTDYLAEKVSLVKFFSGSNSRNISLPQSSETDSLDTYSRGKVIATGKESVKIRTTGLASTNILPVSENCYAGIFSGLDAFEKNKPLMVTFNLNGDTLCKFKKYEYLKTSITSTVIRSYSNSTWHFGQITTIKWAFNDTVFRIIPPNRLVPVYVFKFGELKVTAEEWLHVNIPLDRKVIINEILENQRFLFIDYSNYIPGNKYSKWEKALFDKSNNELYHVVLNDERKNKMYDYGAPDKRWAGGFENDIDGGFPFWPSDITPEGKLALALRPEYLKRFIQNSDYKSGTDPQKKAFTTFVQSLKTGGCESVIMIIE